MLAGDQPKATVMSTGSTLTRLLWPTVGPDGSDAAWRSTPTERPTGGTPGTDHQSYPWRILRVIHRRSGGSGLDG